MQETTKWRCAAELRKQVARGARTQKEPSGCFCIFQIFARCGSLVPFNWRILSKWTVQRMQSVKILLRGFLESSSRAQMVVANTGMQGFNSFHRGFHSFHRGFGFGSARLFLDIG